MRNRILLSLLFSLSLLCVVLALGYSYYDIKEVSGTVHDPEGQPIPAAAVTVAGRSALTDETGRFQLSIPRGSYSVIAFSDGFGSTEQALDTDSFFDKQVLIDLTLQPSEYSPVVVSSDLHQPIAGATIQVAGGQTETTDAQGLALLKSLKTGSELQVFASGYVTGTFEFQPETTKELALAPVLTTIRVLSGSTSQPLPNAGIVAGEQAGQTDAEGKLVLRALLPGIEIIARADGHAAAQATFHGEEEITLVLQPTRAEGVLVDAVTKKPILHALLFYGPQVFETDDKGGWRIDVISPTLKLSAKVPGSRFTSFSLTSTAGSELALQPFKAKGIHIYYAMPRADVVALLDRLVGTEVNTVVLDVKEGPGDVVWASEVPLAKQINSPHVRGISPQELVQICRQRGWYCIARQVIFKDLRLGSAHPEWALHYPNGTLLQQGNEIWMNPARKEVWQYNFALSRELIAMGFDEIQYDYIRYPGTPVPAEFGTVDTRLANIKNFLAAAAALFKPTSAFFSGDTFGLTTATRDEQGIGQRYEDIAPYFDYISPMMYPSTWKGSPSLFREGLENPTCSAALACPYEIILKGTQMAQRRGKTLVRPWLQAYADAGFGVAAYIAQKKGADAADSSGWLFWNNQGLYPDAMWERRGQ